VGHLSTVRVMTDLLEWKYGQCMAQTELLFQPFRLKSLNLKNRFVMAPMTRKFSPGGVPTDDVASYYRRRAEGDVGLILSEGTVINRPASSNEPTVPHFYGDNALAGWKKVVDEVHSAGGAMAPQIWHMGIDGVAMSEEDIQQTIEAFAQSALDAKELGFNAVEIHGAHGYLIDQFFWDKTNLRTDNWGGKTLAERSRFAVAIVTAVRKAVGEDFAIILRLSQWKPTDYTARLATTPKELESWLNPLSEAGVDVFHCSQRRFWEPEFEGSDLNFAGWTKKITGKATITVGSIGLSNEFFKAFRGEGSGPESIDHLVERFTRDEFDLAAVGRPLLSDPYWVQKIRNGHVAELKGFNSEDLKKLT
jgi:2,4-dienoyl-CoA reductase-like NADH-dependent reductase (Old Yellow Enzyme family)